MPDRAFATAARADIRRSGLGISADAGDKHEAGDTGSGSLACERLGASFVHGFERYAGRLDIRGNGVDNGVRPGNGGGNRDLVAHVGAEDCNPVQSRRPQRNPRALGMSDRDAHARTRGREALHEAPAEEAGAPEHADRGHGIRFAMPHTIDGSTAFGAVPADGYGQKARVSRPQTKPRRIR